MTQKNALAFHSVTIKSGDNYNPPKAIYHAGFTAIEYTAIHTGQPCSGTPWLDEMIRAQRRERLAGQVLQSLVARDGDDSAYDLDMVKARPILACDYADALIAAMEGGAK